jgi:predicted aspartyl protease
MGRVTQRVIITNAIDALDVVRGQIAMSDIRSTELEMIVDTGAAMVCLPPTIIQNLGLLYNETMSVRTANGIVERKVFSPVRVEAFGRNAIVEVLENDETTPPLLGYLALEKMDLHVSTKEQILTPNPAYNGKWLIDCL